MNTKLTQEQIIANIFRNNSGKRLYTSDFTGNYEKYMTTSSLHRAIHYMEKRGFVIEHFKKDERGFASYRLISEPKPPQPVIDPRTKPRQNVLFNPFSYPMNLKINL